MLKDHQGLEVTTNSPEAIAAIDKFIEQSLSYGNNHLIILQAIAADPKCALAYAYTAAYYLSLETATAWEQAKHYLQEAKKYKEKTTEREQLYISGIEAWGERDIKKAIACHEEITDKYPQDIISVQQGQYHYFYQGNQKGLLNIAQKVLTANPNHHFLYGIIAFAYEQNYQFELAETWGRKATELNPKDSWAHHAVAHVMETQGRFEEGIQWMEKFSPFWENCNTMLYTHNWWHFGLFYLAKQDINKVLELYDNHIWGRAWKESCKDQIGAISLLLRLELREINVGTRWQQLANYLIPRIHEHALAFQDLHYIYALAKAGKNDLVTEMLTSMESHVNLIKPYLQKTWLEVVIPAARGLVAYANQDWKTTITQLQPILHRLYEVGGSHAQRDLFEEIYLDAWMRNETNSQALELLAKRSQSKRYIPVLPSKFKVKFDNLGVKKYA